MRGDAMVPSSVWGGGMTRVALVGLGEVGRTFAEDLRTAGIQTSPRGTPRSPTRRAGRAPTLATSVSRPPGPGRPRSPVPTSS